MQYNAVFNGDEDNDGPVGGLGAVLSEGFWTIYGSHVENGETLTDMLNPVCIVPVMSRATKAEQEAHAQRIAALLSMCDSDEELSALHDARDHFHSDCEAGRIKYQSE